MSPQVRIVLRAAVGTFVFITSLAGLLSGSLTLGGSLVFANSESIFIWSWIGLVAWLIAWTSHAAMALAWIRNNRKGPAWSVAWTVCIALLIPAMTVLLDDATSDYLLVGLTFMLPHIALTIHLMVFHGRRATPSAP